MGAMGDGAFAQYSGPDIPVLEVHNKKPSPLKKLTVSLIGTYTACNPSFAYTGQSPPKRILTKPSEPAEGSVYDNINSDLIVSVDDVLTSTLGNKYTVKDNLGQGTFGQVFKCLHEETGDVVAVKVIKNQPAYFHQARVEIGVLQFLNTRADADDRNHIVRMQDFFMFRNHLCLVFELLNLNLYELVRHNKYRGLSLPLVRVFVSQMLKALTVLRDSKIIHCDIKPENVLLKNYESGEIKVIDFGSACFENRTVYSYIQSRFYRSPEVVLGHPYTMSIDMWSLGCVAAELFLGLPLFPGACEYDLLSRMVNMLGLPPDSAMSFGKHSSKYFVLKSSSPDGLIIGRQKYTLRTREDFEAFTGQPAPSGKKYFKHSRLADIIGAYPYKSGLGEEDTAREMQNREAFTDFLMGILDMNPETRWTPRQAARHPFITGAPFKGPFQPPAELSTSSSLGAPMSIPRSSSSRNPTSNISSSIAAMTQQQQQHGSLRVGTSAPTSQAAAAAALASSPQLHAQAHVAAMAAVQASMRMQQQQSQLSASFTGRLVNMGPLDGAEPSSSNVYNAAHSLARIIPATSPSYGGVAQTSTSYGMGSYVPPLLAQSFTTSLLSPPSRSFGPHLHVPNYGTTTAAGGGPTDIDGTIGSRGVLPLLGTSLQQGGLHLGSMSFQPSSVSTYQAALAAAHAAISNRNPTDTSSSGALLQNAVLQQQQEPVVVGNDGASWLADGGSVKWTSLDGLSAGTPQIEGQASAVEEAVWDPLWGSDDEGKDEEPQHDQELTLHPVGQHTSQARIALQQASAQGMDPLTAVLPHQTNPEELSIDAGLQLAAQHISQLQFINPDGTRPTSGVQGGDNGLKPTNISQTNDGMLWSPPSVPIEPQQSEVQQQQQQQQSGDDAIPRFQGFELKKSTAQKG